MQVKGTSAQTPASSNRDSNIRDSQHADQATNAIGNSKTVNPAAMSGGKRTGFALVGKWNGRNLNSSPETKQETRNVAPNAEGGLIHSYLEKIMTDTLEIGLTPEEKSAVENRLNDHRTLPQTAESYNEMAQFMVQTQQKALARLSPKLAEKIAAEQDPEKKAMLTKQLNGLNKTGHALAKAAAGYPSHEKTGPESAKPQSQTNHAQALPIESMHRELPPKPPAAVDAQIARHDLNSSLETIQERPDVFGESGFDHNHRLVDVAMTKTLDIGLPPEEMAVVEKRLNDHRTLPQTRESHDQTTQFLVHTQRNVLARERPKLEAKIAAAKDPEKKAEMTKQLSDLMQADHAVVDAAERQAPHQNSGPGGWTPPQNHHQPSPVVVQMATGGPAADPAHMSMNDAMVQHQAMIRDNMRAEWLISQLQMQAELLKKACNAATSAIG